MADEDLDALTSWFKKNVWELSNDNIDVDVDHEVLDEENLVAPASNSDFDDMVFTNLNATPKNVTRVRFVNDSAYDRKKEEQELFEFIAGIDR